MNRKKGLNFFFLILAIIIGSRLYQHIDFQNLTLEKPVLDIIYLVTFVALIIFLVKDFIKQPDR